MKTLVAFLAGIVLAGLLPFAHSARAADRPEGVGANNWVAISDSLGLVLVENTAKEGIIVSPAPRLLAPSASGYFMVKQGRKWQRLVVVEPLRGLGDSG